MFSSLKFKIAIIAFLLISVIMTVTTLRDIRDTKEKLINVQKEKAVLLSERIAHGIMVLMLRNMWKDLQTMLEGIVKDSKELKEIRIFLPESGKIVVSSDRSDIDKKIYKEDMERFSSQNYDDAFIVEKKGKKYASKLTAIKNQPICHKCHNPDKKTLGVLDLELSLDEVYKTIGQLKKEHFIDALIGFSLIIGAFLLIISLLIDRPITKMIHAIKKIEGGDLSVRMKSDSGDELGLLARSFNNMLEALSSAKKEIELSHVQQMEKAAKLASLGEILSGIAHEIKNPLTGISCAMQVIQSDLPKDDNRRTVITEILNQVTRLDRIVKDLLSYARPRQPEFLPTNIRDIIQKAVFFVHPEAKKHKVAIDTDIAGDLHDIMIDPDQMHQVFLNLMINAVQATPQGGKIMVSAHNTSYGDIKNKISSRLKSGKLLAVEFQDTGRGIPAEDLENIFKLFFSKKPKGTGLGLFISQRIVLEHGGIIAAESEVGKGSIFTVYLPVADGNTLKG